MIKQFTYLLLVSILLISPSFIKGQNVALYFDGEGDFIIHPGSLISSSEDFTVEFWFTSTTTDMTTFCPDNLRKLFIVAGANSQIVLGECNGLLNLSIWDDCLTEPSQPEQISNINIRSQPNNLAWHHMVVVKNENELLFYLDCTLTFTKTICSLQQFTGWQFGADIGAPNALTDWNGHIDNIIIWEGIKDEVDINADKYCIPSGDAPNLLLAWLLDDGVPDGDNTNISLITDEGGMNNGIIGEFELQGNISNFVHSTAPIIYPNYHNLTLEIRDYPYRENLLSEICSGDPAHACLYDDGETIPANPNIAVQWEYSDDDGLTWNMLDSPPFTDFCFAIPSGNLSIDCSNSPTGAIKRKIRAVSTIGDALLGASCEQISEEYELEICCPFSSASIDFGATTYFCEGDEIDIEVSLNSNDLFVTNLSPEITIEWFVVENGSSELVESGQTSFDYDNMSAATGTICFNAVLSNCTEKTATFQKCLTVDPEPVAGSIVDKPDPATLTLIATSPHLIYEICPGNDAAIQEDTPFANCNRQWQYSFNPIDQNSWLNMGFSNSAQNTNILPSFQWPVGATSIFYQIECAPLSDPSGCEPAYSNLLEIRLKQAPLSAVIVGNSPICAEDAGTTLSVNNPQSDVLYSWYYNGILIGGGESIFAENGGNYQVEANNGCQTTLSDIFELIECEVIAILSCPNAEGDCIFLGDEIILSACNSEISCDDNPNFFYDFSIDGVDVSAGGCEITHTPLAIGSTYSVTVTDVATGCTAEANRTIIPCESPD